jgi:hypothetical protein
MHSSVIDQVMQNGPKPEAHAQSCSSWICSRGCNRQHPSHNQQPAGVLQLLQPVLEDLQAQLTLQEQGGQAQWLQ